MASLLRSSQSTASFAADAVLLQSCDNCCSEITLDISIPTSIDDRYRTRIEPISIDVAHRLEPQPYQILGNFIASLIDDTIDPEIFEVEFLLGDRFIR